MGSTGPADGEGQNAGDNLTEIMRFKYYLCFKAIYRKNNKFTFMFGMGFDLTAAKIR